MQDSEKRDANPVVVVADSNRERQLRLARWMGEHYRVVTLDNADLLRSEVSVRSPDLIVADLHLQGGSGLDVLNTIGSESAAGEREIPTLLILSAESDADPLLWQEVMRREAVDVLRHPLNESEVLARIELSLKRAREKHKAAASIDKNKSRLEMALVAARMVAIEWDLVADTIKLSDNFIEVFGKLPPSVLEDSETAFRLVHPDDVDQLRSMIENAIAEVSDFHVEFRLIRPDNNEVVWIEERGYTVPDTVGRPVKLIAVAADVTSRVQAEAAIREREQYLQAIFEATPECIKIVARDGKLKRMNAAGLEMIEASTQHHPIGGSVFNLIAPEDRDAFREFNRQVCDGRRRTLQFEIIGLRGTRRHR